VTLPGDIPCGIESVTQCHGECHPAMSPNLNPQNRTPSSSVWLQGILLRHPLAALKNAR
jgi:hypothetical protein